MRIVAKIMTSFSSFCEKVNEDALKMAENVSRVESRQVDAKKTAAVVRDQAAETPPAVHWGKGKVT